MPWHQSFKPLNQLTDVPITNIQGRPHPTADGLVGRAHRDSTDRGFVLVGVNVHLAMAPTPENNMTAIVIAKVTMEDEQGNKYEFEGLGDANPQNCSGQTGAAFPRMAETRAVSRALSVALNISGAVAEELLENGGIPTAPATYQPQGQQYAPPPAAPGAAPAAPSVPANVPAWMYDMPGNKFPKGTKVYDPSVQVNDIQYWLEKGLFKKNQQTGQYDIPDHEKTAVFQAEIARRQGGAPMAHTPAPQQAPVYAPPAGQPPVYNQAPPPPPAPGAPMAQAPVYQPAMPPAAPQAGPWVATPADMAELIKLGMGVGVNLPAIKQMSQATFGNPEPLQLDKASFNVLRAQLGGQPLP